MRTNIDINDHLMSEALRAGGFRTKKAAVEAGLQLLVKVRAQAKIRTCAENCTGKDHLMKCGATDDRRRFLRLNSLLQRCRNPRNLAA